MARLTLVAAGFVPVSLIAVATFGLGELRDTATYVLIAVVALAALAAWRLRRTPRHLILAVAMGVLATSMYDLFRFGFVAMGWMAGDPRRTRYRTSAGHSISIPDGSSAICVGTSSYSRAESGLPASDHTRVEGFADAGFEFANIAERERDGVTEPASR